MVLLDRREEAWGEMMVFLDRREEAWGEMMVFLDRREAWGRMMVLLDRREEAWGEMMVFLDRREGLPDGMTDLQGREDIRSKNRENTKMVLVRMARGIPEVTTAMKGIMAGMEMKLTCSNTMYRQKMILS